MKVIKPTVVSAAIVFALGAPTLPVFGAIYSYCPAKDTFVTAAGSASPFPNVANHNFGGAGSRGVSAADWVGLAQTGPKGPAESLLYFSGISISDPVISSLALELTITKDMSTGSKNLFNKTGNSGYFNVYLLPSDYSWNQGYDAPETSNISSDYGVTWNSLHSNSAFNGKVLLATLYYDYAAQISGAATTYDLSPALSNSVLYNDLKTGGGFTLLMAPADGSKVCFNFASYTQNNGTYQAPMEPTIRTTGPLLKVTAVPEPVTIALLAPAGWLLVRRRRFVHPIA